MSQFSWIPFYEEVANRLVAWEDRQHELISLLKRVSDQGLPVTKLQDQDEQGNKLLLEEIDPFTFVGVFNRGVTDENRRAIASEVKNFLGVEASIPQDFSGVPILNNQSSSWRRLE
jgi:5-methylcytosine-specific restriction enzyme B